MTENNFEQILNQFNWDKVKEKIYQKTATQVEKALYTVNPDLEDFKALISPAAKPYLEEMAKKSQQLTRKRFGNTIQLYLPLYLSNECMNSCVYCGFNHDNSIKRITLSDEQILNEVEIIKKYGYDHILLVTGEHPAKVNLEYFKHVIKLIKPKFSQISMEVQPLDEHEYKKLIEVGLNSVYIYQETYHQDNYTLYHPGGKKANFSYRLDTPDRLGKSGIHKIGLGCLLGLEDWRTDSFFTALHLKYLEKKFWQTKYSISFPRLRPHAGNFKPNSIMFDSDLVQLITAYRIFDEEVELSISVRESEIFRDNIIQLGITSMSAGSSTQPGGYANNNKALKQFATHDNRSPQEIEEMIKSNGYEAVWKDWDYCLQS